MNKATVEVTKPTHTPGPWHVFAGSLGVFNDCDVIYAAHVEDAIVCAMGHDLPEVEANAILIAAAPDLLDALQTARRVLEVACGTKAPYIREAFKVIDAAIAKAVSR